MYRYFLLLMLCGLVQRGFAQQIEVGKLIDMLDWNSRQIDTTLKKKGYLLMQKDIDSTSSLFQYSNLDRQEAEEEAPATVRSFTYMDVSVKQLKSRLITYRTYSPQEYRDIAAYLLGHNYKTTNRFDFTDAKHTLYSDGQHTIRVKVITLKNKKGRAFTAYELEIGK